MSEALKGFPSVELAVVQFAGIDDCAAYRRHLGSSASVLSDPDRRAYRAFGVGRGRFRTVYGRSVWKTYAHVLRQRRRGAFMFGVPRGDTLQLGADIVVAPDSTVAYVSRPQAPDKRPAVAEIIAVVERTLR